MALKLRNRRAETALLAWAEPWTALGRHYGTPDERPALRLAWRALVANQAHDLLTVLLAAHRRSLLAYEQDMDHRGTHALTVARALLTVTAAGDDIRILDHLNA